MEHAKKMARPKKVNLIANNVDTRGITAVSLWSFFWKTLKKF